jgi:hypothetical protein
MTGKDPKHPNPEAHKARRRAPRHAAHHVHHPAKHPPQHHHAAHRVAGPGPDRGRWDKLRRGILRFVARSRVRQLFWGVALGCAIVATGAAALWWRLSQGPIEVPMVTPWLKAAIEENFGDKRTVAVGGTQIERDAHGRTSLRLTDIVVRDADGTVVASAPKAEVGISGAALLTGKVRAQSLNLVGAEMRVRIENDGKVTVFAGANQRPIATALPRAEVQTRPRPLPDAAEPVPLHSGITDLAGALTWIDGLGATGLDGHDLRELGLKDGVLTVDDRRDGKRWSFSHIDVSLRRPAQGGIVVRITSENPDEPWDLSAAMRPLGNGMRAVGLEARKVSSRDLMLALRVDQGEIEANLPLSASVRAEIAPDGMPRVAQGQILVGEGTIDDRVNRNIHVVLDRAELRFSWDGQNGVLVAPFQVHADGNQFTMRATLQKQPNEYGIWLLDLTRDDPVIDPVILGGAGAGDNEAFALNRAMARLRVDLLHKRIDLKQGDFGRVDTRPSHNVAIAVTGSFDYSGAEPRLAFGVAGTRMPVSVIKRIWPIFVASDVRKWVEQHIASGIVERMVVAGNAPLPDFRVNGPPMPTEGLSVEMETSATTVRPIQSLPEIRDADLVVRVTGSTANISLGRGTVDVASGRKLSVTGGVFRVADTHPKPAQSQTTFRVDGTVAAAAELLASDPLRDDAGLSLDPATAHGTVTAQVVVNTPIGKNVPKDAATYTVKADLTNFAADKLLIGQKLEAALLHVNASGAGYEVNGDVKINGTPASLDFHKLRGQPEGDLKLQTTLDEKARIKLGLDLGSTVVGAIPMTVIGKAGSTGYGNQMSVEADLTPVKIDNLLPGWVKPAGKAAHLTYTLVSGPKTTRFDNLMISGSGANVKGSVEFDSNRDISAVDFPVFALSEGDKATLKADRAADGVLRIVMRGEIFDGSNIVKSSLTGTDTDRSKHKLTDIDLDIKIGTVLGRNGETLRGLDVKLTRRAGRIRTFAMKAKIGRESPLIGDLRLRARDNHQVVYLETDDAGALFRFTDMYPRMFGGQMWMAMDPPSQDNTPQQGFLSIRNFTIRGEPGLDRVTSGVPDQASNGVQFSEASCQFTKAPGRMAVQDGVVRGPVVGATVEGQIDYVRDDMHLQGTFVPFYGLNNMFGHIPILGPFLGGSKEGLLGITYDAVGPPSAPRITVNPVSAIAPGVLRKFLPSPGQLDRSFIQPTR